MVIMDLNERKMRILKSIIDEYIDKGEPVGSKHLVEYGNISLSPATIRNEMSELEEMGYLDKPHTSAGRIPSNAAYRIYVEKLMESYRLNVEELELLNELTRYKMNELDKLIARAGRVMSEITHCASISMMRSAGKSTVSRFECMPIDESSFLLVIVLPDGEVKTEHIRTGAKIDAEGVRTISAALNKRLCGVSLEQVSIPTVIELENDFGRYSYLAGTVVKAAYNAVSADASEQVKIDGITNLLSYPEFTDIETVRNILSFIDEKHGKVKSLLEIPQNAGEHNGSDDTTLKVYIGDENRVAELADASVVFCSFPVDSANNAVLGIIGPKRMDYRKVISSLRVLADNLESRGRPPDGENGGNNK